MGDYSVEELKLVYRVLHGHLTEHTELLDSEFFGDLQGFLHRRAVADGVDVGDHGAWDEWLGNAPADCAARAARRSQVL